MKAACAREQSRVRISVQLIDALSGFQVWSSSYDRELIDIFAVQDEISTSIVYALSAAIDQTIGGTQSLRSDAPTGNIEAYQLYLRGMYLWQRRGTQAITAAIAALEQAVDIDPEFVDALSLLAVATAILHEYSGTDRELDFDKADAHASRALALAPTTPMAHAVKGTLPSDGGSGKSRRLISNELLATTQASRSFTSGIPNFLNDLGHHELALVHALKAYQADRLSPQANNILALNFLLLGDNESAIKHVSVAREFGLGGAVPDWVEYFIRLRERNFAAAVEVMQSSLQRSKASVVWVQSAVNAIADANVMSTALSTLTSAQENGELGTSLAFMQ